MVTIDLKKNEREIDVTVQRKIKNEMMGKRYFIAELVKKALDKYFKYDEIVISNENSIYKLPLVNEELNIVDFEINSLSVHVIPTFDKSKNLNVYIPSLYKQYHFKPDMFLFVNFSKTFAKMEILGFVIEPDLNALVLPKAVLSPADNFISTIETLAPRQNKISSGTVETTKELMLAYFENDLSEEGKRFFFKNLITSKEVRKNYKLFYSLNCDFISISKDNNIEKINPAEKRIELFSRSDYLIDKAISKYNADNADKIENAASIDSEPVENYQIEEEKFVGTEEDNILQLSLSPLNLEDDEQEELIEDIPDEQFSNQNHQEENQSSNEEAELFTEEIPADDEELILGETSNQEEKAESAEIIDLADSDLGEEDLLDDTVINLADNAEPEDINILQEETSVTESVLEETLPTEDELMDISETGENVDDVLNESFPDAIELEEGVFEEKQEEIVGEDPTEDDLFAFLSEISDQEIENDANTNFPAQDVAEQVYSAQEDPIIQQQTHITQNEEYITQPLPNDKEEPVSHNNHESNYQETSLQDVSAVQKPKSNTKFMLVAFLALCLLATYQYKDKIIPLLPFGNNDATPTGAMLENNIPAPVGTSKLEEQAVIPSRQENVAQPVAVEGNQPKVDSQNTAVKVESNKPAENLPALPATTIEPPKPKHLNDAIATALTKDFSGVRISRLSWEISETLVVNPEVKRYLTIAGKSVKNALAQDLLSATEPSFNDRIVVNVTYRKDGSVAKVDITSSSGSKQIDDIIIKSVKDTLNYVKMPALNLSDSEYTAKIVIGL